LNEDIEVVMENRVIEVVMDNRIILYIGIIKERKTIMTMSRTHFQEILMDE
jgi:hypothetical protein